MRKAIVSLLSVTFLASGLFAQPLLLEQATNVVPQKTLEVGIDNLSYQSDVAEITNSTIKLTNTALIIPVVARYGVTNDIEAMLTIPYMSLSQKLEIGGNSATTEDAQLADIHIAGKKTIVLPESWGLTGWNLGAMLDLSLPTGSQSDKFTTEFRNGMNIKPLVAASKNFSSNVSFAKELTFNANISYNLTGEYEPKSWGVKLDPADVLEIGVGAESPCVLVNGLNRILELNYRTLSEQKVAGTAIAGTSGSQMDLVLGARYTFLSGLLKSKLGFVLALGDEKYRTYDYKIVAGVTYLWKI
ncbi:MAG: transporter [Endomicrobiales bacterium]|nr:transporter [Endomicrobiales bacterium]